MDDFGFTKANPLLLLTEFSADAGGGGAVIVRSLLRGLDREGVSWLTLSGRASLDTAKWPEQTRLKSGSAGRKPGYQSRFKDSFFYSKALAEEVLRIAAERNARGLWVVLHGAALHVAVHLIRSGKLPLHVSVHDDPPFCTTLRSRKLCLTLPLVERHFAYVLRHARSIDVICASMSARYRERYQVEACVVHRGLESGTDSAAPEFDKRRGLAIGVLGNTYDDRQMRILARAIVRAAEGLGVAGSLTLLGEGCGERLRREFEGRLEIRAEGHIGEDKGIEILKSCFLLYLNYPFSWKCKVFRQTSFPTKLSTYSLCGRPILNHAPLDSSTAALAELRPYFTSWPNESVDDGARLLTEAWKNDVLLRSFHEEGERLRGRFFDYETNRDTLTSALRKLSNTKSLLSNTIAKLR
ncbi:MAG TPA: hypothetical protein VKX17_12715 [Planctomycetota bacterium]|nr:hypothetical protein [Planctomycetota bacterium]